VEPNGGAEHAAGSAYDAPDDGAWPPTTTVHSERWNGDDSDEVEGPCAWADDGDGDLGRDEPPIASGTDATLVDDEPAAWTTPVTIVHDPAACGTGCGPGDDEETVGLDGPDRRHRAGAHHYEVVASPADHEASTTPEADRSDNRAGTGFDVLGVDLELATLDLRIPGWQELCTSAENPREPGQPVRLEPRAGNGGHAFDACADPAGPCDRWWNASVSLDPEGGEEQVAGDADGGPVRATLDHVTTTDAQQPLFPDARTVPLPDEAGPVTAAVRLDHPIAYAGSDANLLVSDGVGRVVELDDAGACPPTTDRPAT